MANKSRAVARERRHSRVRKNLTGSVERPRLNVFRRLSGIYAQVIDDTRGVTLAHVHTFKKGSEERANKSVCNELGKKLAEVCKAKDITKVVFDKNGYAYHGRIQALAEGAREGGLDF